MPSLVHRLAAAFTLLCVLLGTLGGAHPSCGPATERAAGHAAVAHHPAPGGGHDDHCAGDPAGSSSRTPRPDQHGVPAAGCASAAHCVTWTSTATELVDLASSPRTDAAHAPYAPSVPLGPDAEPEFPPPRA